MNELKPIRTNAEHAAALRTVDALLLKAPKPKSAEFDRLEALTILIEAFERHHADHRIDSKVDPVAAIEFHLERLGKDHKDLERVLECTRTRVWEIMKRRRALTLAQIRALVSEYGIAPDRLIAEYRLVPGVVRKQPPPARAGAKKKKLARRKVQKAGTRRRASQSVSA